MNEEYIEISGDVKSVIYHNEDSGYTVLRIGTEDGGEATAVGCMPLAAPGESLTLTGLWNTHPVHGSQFRVTVALRSMPKSAGAIYEYLAAHTVRGIGPATARLIVSAFGEDSLNVIEREPEKLATVKGISESKAFQISENFRDQASLRRLVEFLTQNGIGPQFAMRLFRFYKDRALDMVMADPYILSREHIGAPFAEADNLAFSLGFDDESAERISGAVIFELNHNLGNGHCFLVRDKLIAATSALIEAERESVIEGLEVLCDSGEVVEEEIAGVRGCYLAHMHEAESFVAERILEMSRTAYDEEEDFDGIIGEIEREKGIKYAPLQRRTLELASRRQVIVITGGPGTGKTTSIRAILGLFDRLGLNTMLMAPTGRAAKRMSELSGRDAATVHKALETGFSEFGDEIVFRRDGDNPLETEAIVLDECSMVDIKLMRALLDAMPEECRLVLVGDADQLPPVGPGNVFLDIIRSGVCETVRLTEVFRQTAESRIVSNAHMINRGIKPELTVNEGDFFLLRRQDPTRLVETVTELCASRLPGKMGIEVRDIQVLSPTRVQAAGTANLNLRLQEALNPRSPGKKEKAFGEVVFRCGDKVMQIRNNYDIMWKRRDEGPSGIGIFNGDIGYIEEIDEEGGFLTIAFDDKLASYTFDMLPELEHAFAMTVHKSQGSEYKAVILSALGGPAMLINRSVLYTAVTRARELLIIVGSEDTVSRMIENDKQLRRYSGLRARLNMESGPARA